MGGILKDVTHRRGVEFMDKMASIFVTCYYLLHRWTDPKEFLGVKKPHYLFMSVTCTWLDHLTSQKTQMYTIGSVYLFLQYILLTANSFKGPGSRISYNIPTASLENIQNQWATWILVSQVKYYRKDIDLLHAQAPTPTSPVQRMISVLAFSFHTSRYILWKDLILLQPPLNWTLYV